MPLRKWSEVQEVLHGSYQVICPTCQGLSWSPGSVTWFSDGPRLPLSVCPECQGSGRVHCCEGMVECPDHETIEELKGE